MHVTIPFKTIFQICSFTHRLKSLREADFLTDSDKVFHSRGAEEENEPSYIAFLTWALLESRLS